MSTRSSPFSGKGSGAPPAAKSPAKATGAPSAAAKRALRPSASGLDRGLGSPGNSARPTPSRRRPGDDAGAGGLPPRPPDVPRGEGSRGSLGGRQSASSGSFSGQPGRSGPGDDLFDDDGEADDVFDGDVGAEEDGHIGASGMTVTVTHSDAGKPGGGAGAKAAAKQRATPSTRTSHLVAPGSRGSVLKNPGSPNSGNASARALTPNAELWEELATIRRERDELRTQKHHTEQIASRLSTTDAPAPRMSKVGKLVLPANIAAMEEAHLEQENSSRRSSKRRALDEYDASTDWRKECEELASELTAERQRHAQDSAEQSARAAELQEELATESEAYHSAGAGGQKPPDYDQKMRDHVARTAEAEERLKQELNMLREALEVATTKSGESREEYNVLLEQRMMPVLAEEGQLHEKLSSEETACASLHVENRRLMKEEELRHSSETPVHSSQTPVQSSHDQVHATTEEAPRVGDRVMITDKRINLPGMLRFYGPTKFAAGDWAGVELDEPSGKNDGSVMGVSYFSCQPHYGIFMRPQHVKKLQLAPDVQEAAEPEEEAPAEAGSTNGNQREAAQTPLELLAAIQAKMHASRSRSIELFRKIDTGGDGAVSFEELRAGLETLGVDCNDTEFQMLADYLDKDDNGNVSFKELSRALKLAEREKPAADKAEERLAEKLTDEHAVMLRLEAELNLSRAQAEELEESQAELSRSKGQQGEELEAARKVQAEAVAETASNEMHVARLRAELSQLSAESGSQTEAARELEAAREAKEALQKELTQEEGAHRSARAEVIAETESNEIVIARLQAELSQVSTESGNQAEAARELEAAREAKEALQEELTQEQGAHRSARAAGDTLVAELDAERQRQALTGSAAQEEAHAEIQQHLKEVAVASEELREAKENARQEQQSSDIMVARLEAELSDAGAQNGEALQKAQEEEQWCREAEAASKGLREYESNEVAEGQAVRTRWRGECSEFASKLDELAAELDVERQRHQEDSREQSARSEEAKETLQQELTREAGAHRSARAEGDKLAAELDVERQRHEQNSREQSARAVQAEEALQEELTREAAAHRSARAEGDELASELSVERQRLVQTGNASQEEAVVEIAQHAQEAAAASEEMREVRAKAKEEHECDEMTVARLQADVLRLSAQKGEDFEKTHEVEESKEAELASIRERQTTEIAAIRQLVGTVKNQLQEDGTVRRNAQSRDLEAEREAFTAELARVNAQSGEELEAVRAAFQTEIVRANAENRSAELEAELARASAESREELEAAREDLWHKEEFSRVSHETFEAELARASAESGQELKAVREVFQTELERASAENRSADLEAELARARAESREQVEAERQAAQAELTRESAESREQLQAAHEARVESGEQLQAAQAELTRESAESREQLQAAHEARVESGEQLQATRQEFQAELAELASAKNNSADLEATRQEFQAELTSAKNNSAELEAELARALPEVREQLETAREAEERLRAETASASAELRQEVVTTTESLQEARAEASEDQECNEMKVSRLQAELARASAQSGEELEAAREATRKVLMEAGRRRSGAVSAEGAQLRLELTEIDERCTELQSVEQEQASELRKDVSEITELRSRLVQEHKHDEEAEQAAVKRLRVSLLQTAEVRDEKQAEEVEQLRKVAVQEKNKASALQQRMKRTVATAQSRQDRARELERFASALRLENQQLQEDAGPAFMLRYKSIEFVAEIVAGPEVGKIGLGFGALPPNEVTVVKVTPLTWAEDEGMMVGDEVLEINGYDVNEITEEIFKEEMQSRPLTLKFWRCKINDEATGRVVGAHISGVHTPPLEPEEESCLSVVEEEDETELEDQAPKTVTQLEDQAQKTGVADDVRQEPQGSHSSDEEF